MKAVRPDISYIVSLYSRPVLLASCVYSLLGQTHQDFEVIITDNTVDDVIAQQQKAFIAGLGDKRFRYVRTAGKIKVSDCYWSAEYGMKLASGKWFCFPCEDCYYPPEWASRMLGAAYRKGLDLVLCGDNVTGPEPCGADRYFAMELGTPSMPGYKPSFIVRREKFAGWVNKPVVGACSGVDRTTLQYLMRDPKIRWGACRDLFYVHN